MNVLTVLTVLTEIDLYLKSDCRFANKILFLFLI